MVVNQINFQHFVGCRLATLCRFATSPQASHCGRLRCAFRASTAARRRRRAQSQARPLDRSMITGHRSRAPRSRDQGARTAVVAAGLGRVARAPRYPAVLGCGDGQLLSKRNLAVGWVSTCRQYRGLQTRSGPRTAHTHTTVAGARVTLTCVPLSCRFSCVAARFPSCVFDTERTTEQFIRHDR